MSMFKKLPYKLFAVVLIAISIFSSSCNKWLELQPQDGLIQEEYWKTREQLDAAVMGCYASLLGGSRMPLAKYLFIWGEVRGDMVRPVFEPESEDDEALLGTLIRDELNMIRSDISSTNTLTNWEAVYKTINYCNTVIKFGPQVLETDKTMDQPELNTYLAEAHGLRGLMYFYLLRSFGDVPLKIEPTNTDAQVVQIPKNTKEEVYAQVISDLKFASENAVNTYRNLTEDKGRINKYTAYTILADAYLWNEEYAKCLEACQKVIDSKKYQLFPAGTLRSDWYQGVYFNGNSVEGIFEFQFDNQKLNPFYNMFLTEFKAADWIPYGGLYGVDVQDPFNVDIRGNFTSMLESNGAIYKYNGGRTTATSYAHWFAYRYSDVLLMKAEALTWLSPGNAANGTEAINIVNDIRLKRHALNIVDGKTIEAPEPTETADVSMYILDERAREFAFEGKRWYDILRHAKRNNYANEKILLDVVTSSAPPAKQQTVINKYKDHRSHYFPIYTYELQTNKALVQNSFYQ